MRMMSFVRVQIVKVNGVAVVGQALFEAISDPDVPGASVLLMVRQAHTVTFDDWPFFWCATPGCVRHFRFDAHLLSMVVQGKFEEVRLRRISTLEVAGRRKLFDNFCDINDRMKKELDHDGVRLVEETMDLWENQLIAQNDRDESASSSWAVFQETSLGWSGELFDLLESMHAAISGEMQDRVSSLQAEPTTEFSRRAAREPVTEFSSRNPVSKGAERVSSKLDDDRMSLIQTCDALCLSLDEHLRTKIDRDGEHAADGAQKSTLGFKYNTATLVIEYLDVGGPAYNSERIFRGDTLLAVGNVQVSKIMAPDAVGALLKGNDVTGSSTTLLLRCTQTSRVKQVSLTRMPAGELGDSLLPPQSGCILHLCPLALTVPCFSSFFYHCKHLLVCNLSNFLSLPPSTITAGVRMSQIFTCLKDQALDHSDELATRLLDECIELWAAMLKSSARKGHLTIGLNEE